MSKSKTVATTSWLGMLMLLLAFAGWSVSLTGCAVAAGAAAGGAAGYIAGHEAGEEEAEEELGVDDDDDDD